MNNVNNNTISDGMYFATILIKYKKFILITTLVAAITSVIISLLLPIWYASTINFVPPIESSSKSSTSGIGAALKEFGVSKIGGGGADEYTMLVFLNSRSVADSMIKKYDLVKRYNMADGYYVEVRDEFWNNVKVEYLKEGNYELTVWDKDSLIAADMANDFIVITNHFAEVTKNEELKTNVEYLTNRIASIDSTINVISAELGKFTNDKSFFSPEEQSKAAATALGSVKSTELEYGIVYEYFLKMFGENDPQTQNAKTLLNTAKKKTEDALSKPGFIGNFALRDATPIAVEYFKKYADIEALTKTKALITTSLEKANLDYHNNNINFFVVDKAVPSDKKDKPKRVLICAGGTFTGFFISILIVLIFNGIKIASKQAKMLNSNI